MNASRPRSTFNALLGWPITLAALLAAGCTGGSGDEQVAHTGAGGTTIGDDASTDAAGGDAKPDGAPPDVSGQGGGGGGGSGGGGGFGGAGGTDPIDPHVQDGGQCAFGLQPGDPCGYLLPGSWCVAAQCTQCTCEATHTWSCGDTCDGSTPQPLDGGACPANLQSGDDCSGFTWGSRCETDALSCLCNPLEGRWRCGTPCDEPPTMVNGSLRCPACAAPGASCISAPMGQGTFCEREGGSCSCLSTWQWQCGVP